MTLYTLTTHGSPLTQTTSVAIKTSENFVGRTFSKIGQVLKTTSIKVKDAIVNFFKNIPNYLKTGIGAGIIGTTVGLAGLITVQLTLENYKVARVVLTIFFSAVLFTSAALMFAFGKNPIMIQ